MAIISAKKLSKEFKIHQKEPGFSGSFRALFQRQYEIVSAVHNLDLEITSGELVGFIGPNGAGKTTTLKMFSGLLHPTSGQVNIMGFQPYHRKPAFLKQIALVMGQKNQLWWDLPAMETFLLNQAIYEIPDKTFKKNLAKLVELLAIQDILKTPVRKLSLGQRMKCELIAALLHSPKVLFLDEPTIGLDVIMQQTVRQFIQDYNQEFNSTIILTSHYMDDVKQLCKRVIIIDQGKIKFDGQLSEVIKKYALHKVLTLVFNQKIIKSDLDSYGEITSYNWPTVKLRVDRNQAATTASRLLKQFKIEDVTIEETAIETIIRDIFQDDPSS